MIISVIMTVYDPHDWLLFPLPNKLIKHWAEWKQSGVSVTFQKVQHHWQCRIAVWGGIILMHRSRLPPIWLLISDTCKLGTCRWFGTFDTTGAALDLRLCRTASPGKGHGINMLKQIHPRHGHNYATQRRKYVDMWQLSMEPWLTEKYRNVRHPFT